MSAQTSYRFGTPIGSPGGIIDLAPYAIDTFLNDEPNGVMMFGLGVVQGDNAGTCIKLPTTADDTSVFEGVVVNNRTREYDLEGRIYIRHGVSAGVMRYGRVYVRVAEGEDAIEKSIKYGDPLYVITKDADIGRFTNKEDSNLKVAGRFLGGVDEGVAPVELYNPNYVPKSE